MSTRSYHHGNVRTASMDAALLILDAEGPGALTLRRVARDASVSHTAVGKEFGGLSALVTACAAQVYRDLAAAQRTLAACETDPLNALRALGEAYLDYGLAYPQRIQLLGHPMVALVTDDPDLDAARQATHSQLVRHATACVTEGCVRPADPEALAVYVWSAVHGFSTLFSRTSADMSGQTTQLMDSLYLGLRPL